MAIKYFREGRAVRKKKEKANLTVARSSEAGKCEPRMIALANKGIKHRDNDNGRVRAVDEENCLFRELKDQ